MAKNDAKAAGKATAEEEKKRGGEENVGEARNNPEDNAPNQTAGGADGDQGVIQEEQYPAVVVKLNPRLFLTGGADGGGGKVYHTGDVVPHDEFERLATFKDRDGQRIFLKGGEV